MQKYLVMVLIPFTCMQGCAVVSTTSTAISIVVTTAGVGVDAAVVVIDSITPGDDD
ncbi:MAG: hypothetical protein ABGX03_00200 [Methylophilaceae bacterium]